jgi:hypothetical protein
MAEPSLAQNPGTGGGQGDFNGALSGSQRNVGSFQQLPTIYVGRPYPGGVEINHLEIDNGTVSSAQRQIKTKAYDWVYMTGINLDYFGQVLLRIGTRVYSPLNATIFSKQISFQIPDYDSSLLSGGGVIRLEFRSTRPSVYSCRLDNQLIYKTSSQEEEESKERSRKASQAQKNAEEADSGFSGTVKSHGGRNLGASGTVSSANSANIASSSQAAALGSAAATAGTVGLSAEENIEDEDETASGSVTVESESPEEASSTLSGTVQSYGGGDIGVSSTGSASNSATISSSSTVQQSGGSLNLTGAPSGTAEVSAETISSGQTTSQAGEISVSGTVSSSQPEQSLNISASGTLSGGGGTLGGEVSGTVQTQTQNQGSIGANVSAQVESPQTSAQGAEIKQSQTIQGAGGGASPASGGAQVSAGGPGAPSAGTAGTGMSATLSQGGTLGYGLNMFGTPPVSSSILNNGTISGGAAAAAEPEKAPLPENPSQNVAETNGTAPEQASGPQNDVGDQELNPQEEPQSQAALDESPEQTAPEETSPVSNQAAPEKSVTPAKSAPPPGTKGIDGVSPKGNSGLPKNISQVMPALQALNSAVPELEQYLPMMKKLKDMDLANGKNNQIIQKGLAMGSHAAQLAGQQGAAGGLDQAGNFMNPELAEGAGSPNSKIGLNDDEIRTINEEGGSNQPNVLPSEMDSDLDVVTKAKHYKAMLQLATEIAELTGNDDVADVLKDIDGQVDPEALANASPEERSALASNMAGRSAALAARHAGKLSGGRVDDLSGGKAAAIGGAVAGLAQGEGIVDIAKNSLSWYLLYLAFGSLYTFAGTIPALIYLNIHYIGSKLKIKWFTNMTVLQRTQLFIADILVTLAIAFVLAVLVLAGCNYPIPGGGGALANYKLSVLGAIIGSGCKPFSLVNYFLK